MKKAALFILVGILIGLLCGYIYLTKKEAPLKKENAALKEEITAMKVDQQHLEEQSSKKIEELLSEIGGLQGNIDSLMTVNNDLENDLAASKQDAAQLEAAAAMLQAEVQPAIDANPKLKEFVGNLMGQIASGKEQISVLAKQVGTWRGAFANSEKKGLLIQAESDTYKALWTGEKALRQKVELRLNLQTKRVSLLQGRLRLTTTGGLLIAGVVLATTLLH